MAAADHGRPSPDLYQLLGVSREASREEIALAWRRRARDEHPDARPDDADAPSRFRAPARRAAYDRTLGREQQPAARVRVTVRRPSGTPGTGGMMPLASMLGPPLRAGPVRVEGSRPAPPANGPDEQDVRLAVLAELALRYLAVDRSQPW
jgi:hypothetical protein